MRRLALVLACGALWLILAAVPALADGGPHVMTSNNGSLGINADGCAGCHRAHTAEGPYLINAADEEALCLTCHGSAVTGSTVDVMNGIQYALAGRSGGTQLGALRGGGFVYARMGDAARVATSTGGGLRTKVPVGSPEVVTSSHLDLDGGGGVVATGIAWGNGSNGSGEGPDIELSCASCHNPHGNGQYRILNPMPNPTVVTGTFDATVPVSIVASNAVADLITTSTNHTLQVGDLVTISGHTPTQINGSWTVVEIPNGVSFKIAATLVAAASALDITADGTGGTLVHTSYPVTDAPAPPGGDTRNYTVIQKVGTQGTDSTYLLYASQVQAAAVAGSRKAVIGIASSDATTEVFTTASAHGFVVGDTVNIQYHNALLPDGADAGTDPDAISNTTAYTILAVPTATTFTLTGVDIVQSGTNVGVVTKNLTGTYAPTDGDYFHRTAPWYYTSGQADDAPNGQPATSTTLGDVAFDVQITAWCSSCHTRYYANQNANPGGLPGSSAASLRNITAVTGATDQFTTSANHGFYVGDVVAIASGSGYDGSYTVRTVPSSTTFTVYASGTTGPALDITADATFVDPFPTAIRTSAVQVASAWWFPRPGDDLYQYQHRTVPNRACTTCHVSHGSNAQMTGTFSSTFTRPDGVASSSSRLLKIDNRGTCQACHDPTRTIPAGSYTGLPAVTP